MHDRLKVRTKKIGLRLKKWEVVSFFGDVVAKGTVTDSMRAAKIAGKQVRDELIKNSSGIWKPHGKCSDHV